MKAAPEDDSPATRPRPLPSVGIALLPHERRAERAKQWGLAVAGFVVLLVAAALIFGPALVERMRTRAPHPDDPSAAMSASAAAYPEGPVLEAPAADAATPAAQAVVAEIGRDTSGALTESTDPPSPFDALPEPAAATSALAPGVGTGELARRETQFGKASSWKDALRKNGTSPDEANALIAALEKHVNFAHGKPEHTFVFERDVDGLLQAFEYHAAVTEYVRVTRKADGKLQAERINVPIERRRVAKGTEIAGSLGHSLGALGLGAQLAGVVIEAFDAKISFTREARVGDSVRLIVDEEYIDGKFFRYGTVHAIEYTSGRKGKLRTFWFEAERGQGEFYDESGRAMHGGWLRTPLRYDHISSPFNPRRKHPILKRIVPHQGVDYSAGTGTPVWAAGDGSITFAGMRGANGNLVSIKHGNGYETFYAHLWRIAPGMRPGIKVKQKQLIGYVGTTGRSTGPHLHFALKRNGRFIDPANQLNGPGLPLPASAMPRFRALAQRLRKELDRIPLAPPPARTEAHDDAHDTAEDDLDL